MKGVGEKLAELLAKAEIRTLWDLLFLLPRSYEDRRKFYDYAAIEEAALTGDTVYSRGVIEKWAVQRMGPGGRARLEASVRLLGPDAKAEDVEIATVFSPRVHFVFFQAFGGHWNKSFPEGTTVFFRGKAQGFRGRLQIAHPDILDSRAEAPEWEKGIFAPIYREIQGVSTKALRKILFHALDLPPARRLPDILPRALTERLGLPPLAVSLRELHFPKHWDPSATELRPGGACFRRVVFEELFLMSLALHLRRSEWRVVQDRAADRVPAIAFRPAWLDEAEAKLPFRLTGDQRRGLEDIAHDLSCARERIPMHRLLQGDVGAGKTIVAFLSALAVMDAGYQVALMAPTEILANQHFANFARLFPERAHEAILLKGALTAKTKREVREKLERGESRFVIGTQALLTDTTVFEKLAFVIIDEQHRFGVEQRLGLKHQATGLTPHLLVMTATPIPRSLALTLYGDLSVSLVKEKPPGRIPIRTHVVKRRAFDALVHRLGQFLEEGRQIYLVYPLVEESEELDLKDVKTAFDEWRARFPATPIGLLHGRMKAAEKDKAMRAFSAGETRILVATTVIEVGVDVPNASVIVIEHAERFGLSQLHQLRGRVGRGAKESFCVLLSSDNPSESVRERLGVMENSEDGFYIAEKDLEIRGPGEFLGRRQSGLPGFRVAHILRDLNVLEVARREARAILDEDPRLERLENRPLRRMIEKWWGGRMELTLSG